MSLCCGWGMVTPPVRATRGAASPYMNRGRSLIGGPLRLPGSGASQEEKHRPNCLCCIGPPDHAFELACAAVKSLAIEGVGGQEAEKFVRLCCTAGGGDAAPLSKSKAKAACKSIRPKALGLPPIDPETLERMQRAVLEVYGKQIESTTSATVTTSIAATSPPAESTAAAAAAAAAPQQESAATQATD